MHIKRVFFEKMMTLLRFNKDFVALLIPYVRSVKSKVRFPLHPICSCFVEKASQVFLIIERRFVAWKMLGFAEMLHQCHIYSFMMIA
jgi:hypothetical protein